MGCGIQDAGDLPTGKPAHRPGGVLDHGPGVVGPNARHAALLAHEHVCQSRGSGGAKGPGATVMEALDQVWLFSIGAAGGRTPGGKRVAEIGPLPVKAGTKYTAQYMEAIFPPGAETRPHTHPGPEAWYHAAGGVCLETPEGKAFGRAGDNGFIVPGDRPMRLTVTETEERRSIVLILYETGKPASGLDTKWVPKGLCRD